jgi:hypothetical protein
MAPLGTYTSATQQLLSNPAAPTTLYSTSDIQGYVNEARLQLAGVTECVRGLVTLTVTTVTNTYPFSSLTVLPTGTQGVYNLRQGMRVSGSGFIYMGSRPYPWAQLYWMNTATPTAGNPTEWSQFGIGASGSLVLDKTPSVTTVLKFDASCQPSVLATNSDAEAIPDRYTDAVPFFAAYFAYMSAQRQSDAEQMMKRYKEFVGRARNIAVPNVLSGQYDQSPQPTAQPQAMGNTLSGLLGAGGGVGGGMGGPAGLGGMGGGS